MLILVVVLGLHGAAWWLLNARSVVVWDLPASNPVRVSLRWLPSPEPAPKPPTAVPEPKSSLLAPPLRTSRKAAAPAVPERRPRTGPTQVAIAASAPPATAAASAALPAQAAASSAGPLRPGILDSPATRQAILDAARAPSLAELPGTSRRAGQTQQLGSAIASGAHGDCDKGEFVGGAMGLLTLPFWVVAKLRGDCGR
ncbi:MAG: hypothetical protein ABI633_09925 [Burkholderiales bacterium]